MSSDAPTKEPWDRRLTGHLARQAREAANDPARRPENRPRATRRDWVWVGFSVLLFEGSRVAWDQVSVLAGVGVFGVGLAVVAVVSRRY